MTVGGKLFAAGLVVCAGGLAATLIVDPSLKMPLTLLEAAFSGALLIPGVAIGLCGIAVYVFDRRAAAAGSLRLALGMLLLALVAGVAASLPYQISYAFDVTRPRPGPLTITYLVAIVAAPLVLLVWRRLIVMEGLRWSELGVRASRSTILTGLAGAVLVLAVSVLVNPILSRLGINQDQYQEFEGIIGAPIPLFAVSMAAGCVLAPFAEELFFRGYIFQFTRLRHGPVVAYGFSSALFAVVHFNIAAALPILLIGLVLAWLFSRSGSILPGVIAHGLSNALSFVLLYLGFTN